MNAHDQLRHHGAPRFRVLVVGRANAGKTTILRAVCGTNERPTVIKAKKSTILTPYRFVHDRIKDTRSVVKPSTGRGRHDIEDELIFLNTPEYVFHDSRGFESGTAEGLEVVRAFINKRARCKSVKNQLHAIWLCLPTDHEANMIAAAESNFFEDCDPGSVPVIAIFTKFDSLDMESFRTLRDQGLSYSEARAKCSQHADERFNRVHLPRILAQKFPPAAVVCLRYMHQAQEHQDLIRESIKELIQKTADSLNPETLKTLHSSIPEDHPELNREQTLTRQVSAYLCIGARRMDI
ncbi:hypothetical protein BOTBODRAFT_29006 [Botryobasidium botryosum FD-172 SS1]|uniref:Uncharacterized protein n=1 Tax=Botryobasidium botryosum (strain FD-172 SS1) TaxID=930990 RepID=A0A067MSA8_BOTB1|nr:hypothetical protein BOTBODRAFT_29006 [Botryobasidium botryosum FD-172 SS1]